MANESESCLEAVINTIIDGIITINSQGIIQSVNPAVKHLFGYEEKELINQNIRILMPEPYASHHDAYLAHYLRTGEKKIIDIGREVTGKRKDGTTFPMRLAVSEFDFNGERMFAGIVKNISEETEAFVSLQKHKERLRRGQLYANIGTWEWDIQTDDLFWSERIAPLFGYPEGDLETSYENFLAAVHPDDRTAVSNAVNVCISDDIPYEIEHRVVWPDGTVRWLLERGAVIRDENGKAMQMLGVVQDIDDRKRAEMALSASEQQLRLAQSIAHIGDWHANLITGELVWADEIYRIFGYEPGEIPVNIERFYAAVHPDDLERLQESERRAGRTGTHEAIYRIVRKDGTIRHIHEIARADVDKEGAVISLTGTAQDITDTVEDQQNILDALFEAERANQAKSEFLSSMSHELRTPMNAILGFAQLLEYEKNLTEEAEEYVGEILKAGNHLLLLINEVLDLSKVESGHIELFLEPVAVDTLLEECISLVSKLAEQRDIQIRCQDMNGLVVKADRIRLKQSLINLISNAIKYNRAGGSVSIDFKVLDGRTVRICIVDTGPGIAPENLSLLFMPFSRLDNDNTEVEGTGIGLALTRSIVEMMGGAVGVESKLGTGSTFWIDVPLESALDELDENPDQQAATPLSIEGNAGKRYVVLYIEDNQANMRLVAQLLGMRKDIELIPAHTAQLGIDLALTRSPDLILLDINLPGMDGYEVLDILKDSNQVNDVPIVAITANAMSHDVECGKQADFTDYLTKPLDVQKFLSVVDRLL